MKVSELPVLDAEEQRILGSLLEKQTTVPASYPLSANALKTACNQTSNREPVVDLDQQTVERTAKALKDRGLLRIVWSDTGRRTLKYHQVLDEHLGLEPDERALLTVLLLRGAQAPGELRTRTERLHGFADRGEVEACLDRMAIRPQPLVRELERRPGQQDPRWVHLLGPAPEQAAGDAAAGNTDGEAVVARPFGQPDAATSHVELVRAAGLADTVPYAYAAVAHGLVFTAGACPLDADGAVVAEGDVAGQAAVVMDNLVTALEASGCTLTDVVRSTVYVASSDRSQLVAAWTVVRDRFAEHDAPSTLLGVAQLGYPGQLVEVEAVAVRP